MNLIPWRNKDKNTDIVERDSDNSLDRFRSEMDRVFDRFFNEPFSGLSEIWSGMDQFGPSLDMTETDSSVVVKAEIPGVDPKEVDITISGNMLTISGEKKETTERKKESFHHCERRFGSFRRSVQLPSYVDTEKVSAEHSNGVLTIQLDKLQSATPKRIPVKSG